MFKIIKIVKVIKKDSLNLVNRLQNFVINLNQFNLCQFNLYHIKPTKFLNLIS